MNAKCMMHKFSLRVWCGYVHQPQKYYNDSLSFYFDAFNANYDFEVSVANDVAIEVDRLALPGKGRDAVITLPGSAHFNQ